MRKWEYVVLFFWWFSINVMHEFNSRIIKNLCRVIEKHSIATVRKQVSNPIFWTVIHILKNNHILLDFINLFRFQNFFFPSFQISFILFSSSTKEPIRSCFSKLMRLFASGSLAPCWVWHELLDVGFCWGTCKCVTWKTFRDCSSHVEKFML